MKDRRTRRRCSWSSQLTRLWHAGRSTQALGLMSAWPASFSRQLGGKDCGGDVPWSQRVALTRYFVVPPLGLEPRTCGLRVRCSAIELEGRVAGELLASSWRVWRSGSVEIHTTGRQHAAVRPRVTDGTRTRDSQYHKLELYQLSYGHHEGCTVCQTRCGLPPAVQRRSASLGHAGGGYAGLFPQCCEASPTNPYTMDFVVS